MLRLMGILVLALIASPASAQVFAHHDTFAACTDAASQPALAGSLCSTIAAPLDRRHPALGKVELFVRKFPAIGRSKGQLWLIAGGPGESGASFYPFLTILRAAAPGYDLLIPDHRGTGYSTRLCPAEEAASSDGGTALAGAEWGTCFAALNADAERTRAFTISNAAFDLQALIDRLSTGRRTYLYGVSYGTQLVVRTLAIAPPRRLDGVILDSLVPPDATRIWDLSHRSAVVDAVGRQVLATCDGDAKCSARFGGSAERALRSIVDDPKTPALLGGNPKYFFGALLDFPDLRAQIPDIMAAILRGDKAPIDRITAREEEIGQRFNAYPQSPSSIPLVSLISRSENDARPGLTAAELASETAAYLFASPLPEQLLRAGLPVYPHDADFGATPKRLPPTLVVQGDLDPKTPYEGALAQIRQLNKAGPVTLLTVSGGPHFALFTAPECLGPAIHRFLTTHRPSAIDHRRRGVRSTCPMGRSLREHCPARPANAASTFSYSRVSSSASATCAMSAPLAVTRQRSGAAASMVVTALCGQTPREFR